MAAAAASRSIGPAGDNPALPPSDAYRIAVEEYRFQAQFNWARAQYLLAFNAAILAAGTGLYASAGRVAAVVFSLGAVAAALSSLVISTQHKYYRFARDHMRRVEVVLAIPVDLRLDTTSSLGGPSRRISVNQVIYLLLGAIAAANAIGVLLAVRS